MAKKSKKRPKDQGCVWSLINIFDFRQGRSAQKLLPDRKRGSKRVVGAAFPEINLELLSDSCDVCKEHNDSVHSGTSSSIDTSKMSVKELMHEEMCGEHDQKKHGSVADGDATSDGVHGKKNHRRTRSKASVDLGAIGFAASKDSVPEKPVHRKHKSASSVDLNVIVEELCSRIHQNDISCLKDSQDGELGDRPIEDPSVLEEKLWEATKMIMNHFTEGKSFVKDGKTQCSKELVEALQILDSNKEVYLKLLQDSDSQLAKRVQSLQDIQVEEGKFKVLTGSNMLAQDIGNNNKQHGFFWKRFTSSKKSDASDVLNRIVVLKPGPHGSRNSDVSSACGSLPESPRSVGDNTRNERVSSTFSFSEFKRKLKHVMRKDQHEVVLNEFSDEQPKSTNREKKVGGDQTVGMASPSRDHFFIERIPRPSVGIKKVDKTTKPKDGKISIEHDTAPVPEQRVSNIYAEAKKHLAEIVGNSDLDVDTPGRQVPKSLGRILSYSGYTSPSISSPRKEGEIKLSTDGECRSDDKIEVIQENDISLPGQSKQESEPRISDVEPTSEPEIPTSKADADRIRSPDVESHKVSSLLEIPSEPSCLQPVSTNDQVNGSLTSRQEAYDENSFSTASILTSSMTDKNEEVDTVSDATSRPSPVSVLEPIFKDDDISPPAIKYLAGVESIQPRKIRFEDEISTPLQQVLNSRINIEGEKYTSEFVKSVVTMSRLTWDELLRRSLFADHLIEPSLLDEVDFLPDLLPWDFNLLFDLINEVSIEICQLHFSCMLSIAKPLIQPELMGKDIFTEIWKGVNWYLKLDGPPRTLDHIVTKDLEKSGNWMNLCPDREIVGIQLQQAIFEELLEDAVLGCVNENIDTESPVLESAEVESEIIME